MTDLGTLLLRNLARAGVLEQAPEPPGTSVPSELEQAPETPGTVVLSAMEQARGALISLIHSRHSDRYAALLNRAVSTEAETLALLWQIYSCRRSLQIHFRQCGHRRGGSRAKSSRMAWRTAGKVG
jgi:hypothetical protein